MELYRIVKLREAVPYNVRKVFLKQCKGILSYGFMDTSRKAVLYYARNALLKRCKGILSY